MTLKPLDLICLGRVAVDLYGEQIGSRLEDMRGFAKYLGGSSGNIAAGASRLGLKTAMLSRVGDEHLGRFVREELERASVDTSHLVTDPDRLTGLVILGVKDKETFPLVFYRRDCADMAIDPSDFDEKFIGSANALLVTGTHLSTAQTYSASMTAIAYARKAQTKVVLDIDYRPVLWGLAGIGEGENRYVASNEVTAHLQKVLPECDLIVGTEEEFQIAAGSEYTLDAMLAVRRLTDAALVLKLGDRGCTVFEGTIPESQDDYEVHSGNVVEVLNVLGAGDAFLSGFLRGWLRGESIDRSCEYGNACGALVVSRHGCYPATPTFEELEYFLTSDRSGALLECDSSLDYLHRVTTRQPETWGELCIFAFDHRSQLREMAETAGANSDRLPRLKDLMLEAVLQASEELPSHLSPGVLLDDTYGREALNRITGHGWWIGRPVEQPGSRPLELEGGRNISAKLRSWASEHVVKCLCYYHPDDPLDLRVVQERQVVELYKACVAEGLEFLLELVPPPGGVAQVDIHTLPNAMQRFYNLGVYPDWWKLPSPSEEGWDLIDNIIDERAPHCRGVLLLGFDAPENVLKKGFQSSARSKHCRGFAVGRTLFSTPAASWLSNEIGDQELVARLKSNYLRLVELWKLRRSV